MIRFFNQAVTANFLFTRYVCSDGICEGKTLCHRTISEAVTASGTGTLIKIAAETHTGGFSLDADKSLTLVGGGWENAFTNPNGGNNDPEGSAQGPARLAGTTEFEDCALIRSEGT